MKIFLLACHSPFPSLNLQCNHIQPISANGSYLFRISSIISDTLNSRFLQHVNLTTLYILFIILCHVGFFYRCERHKMVPLRQFKAIMTPLLVEMLPLHKSKGVSLCYNHTKFSEVSMINKGITAIWNTVHDILRH